MRLNRTDVVTREQFLVSLFQQNPGLSVSEANQKLVEANLAGGQRKMRPGRVQELKLQVTGTVTTGPALNSVQTGQ